MNSARFEKYLICIVITICSMNEKQSEIRTILSYSIPGIISMLLSAALTLKDAKYYNAGTLLHWDNICGPLLLFRGKVRTALRCGRNGVLICRQMFQDCIGSLPDYGL